MKILIVTSKDHIYANVLLRELFKRGVFNNDTVMIWEQDSIVPGKSKVAGLWRYVRRSGFLYVRAQIMKQCMFLCLRFAVGLLDTTRNLYYPYWATPSFRGTRETYGGMRTDAAYVRVRAFKPDLLLSLYSKEILPERVLRIPKFGAVNVHPAYLPEYRGVSPIFWAMAKNAPYIGVTIHSMDVGIDTGLIYAHKKIPMHSPSSEHAMYMQATLEGITLLTAYIVRLHTKPNTIKGIPISHSTDYYSLPTRDAVLAMYANGYSFFRIADFL
jgi:hypothetical protein